MEIEMLFEGIWVEIGAAKDDDGESKYLSPTVFVCVYQPRLFAASCCALCQNINNDFNSYFFSSYLQDTEMPILIAFKRFHFSLTAQSMKCLSR